MNFNYIFFVKQTIPNENIGFHEIKHKIGDYTKQDDQTEG
jgi:hypothetical protein